MTEDRTFLISITNGIALYRVAIKVNPSMFTGDACEYPLEPENRQQFFKLLPRHVQFIGKIVEIEDIFDVVDKTLPSNL